MNSILCMPLEVTQEYQEGIKSDEYYILLENNRHSIKSIYGHFYSSCDRQWTDP